MKDFDQIEQIEKEIKEQIDGMSVKPFNQIFNEIEPRLKEKTKSNQGEHIHHVGRHGKQGTAVAVMKPITVVFVALLILFAGGVVGFFISKGLYDLPPRYSDNNVNARSCTYEEILEYDIYLPDILLLSEATYKLGKHIESEEDVFFNITGYVETDTEYCEIEMYIIFNERYDKANERNYKNLPNSLQLGDKNISYSNPIDSEPFYEYYVSCVYQKVRYYCNFFILGESDVNMFLQLFFSK